jgi:hypothetical protein
MDLIFDFLFGLGIVCAVVFIFGDSGPRWP